VIAQFACIQANEEVDPLTRENMSRVMLLKSPTQKARELARFNKISEVYRRKIECVNTHFSCYATQRRCDRRHLPEDCASLASPEAGVRHRLLLSTRIWLSPVAFFRVAGPRRIRVRVPRICGPRRVLEKFPPVPGGFSRSSRTSLGELTLYFDERKA
jgi:hypothetical protein